MRAAGGNRIELTDVPDDVRNALGHALGASIVEAVNQAGGFSPGLAARCRLEDGRRVFVKAVSPAQNPMACRIHRREIEIASQLPAGLPAPRLLHAHDDGEWVALVFEEVAGRQPHEPWQLDELDRVMEAIAAFHAAATPSPLPDAQSVVDRYAAVFHGWRRLADGDGDLDALEPWCRASLDRLAELESRWDGAVGGDTLLHTDLRADNVLLGDDGTVALVDWPWACNGAPVFDLALVVFPVGLGGGPDPGTVIDRYGIFDGVDADDALALCVAFAGFLVRSSQDPPPPGLPTVRDFQRAQADVALGWLRTMIA